MTILSTERLTIRDYIESDFNDLHSVLSDAAHMYFLDDIVSRSREDTRANLNAAALNENGHYFCVRESGTGAYVGSVGYDITDVTPIGKIAHMGYWAHPARQGRGYITEAVKRVLAFAFEEDGCIRVTTGCYSDNKASRRVMEKAGFRREGERIAAAWHDGKMKDRLDYAVNIN